MNYLASPPHASILSKGVIESSDPNKVVIGTGAFQMVEFRPNDTMLLEKNPQYWEKGLPYLDELEIRSFPLVILALGIIAMLGPSTINLIVTIGVVYTPTFVRLVNGSVLSTKGNEYVLAARALGSRDLRILFSHTPPTSWPRSSCRRA